MKDKLTAKIFCNKNNRGTLDFYLKIRHNIYYLFTTSYYSQNIYEEYQSGKIVSDVYQKTRCVRQQKLRERIIRMAKYTAFENELDIFGHNSKANYTPIKTIDTFSEFII